MSLSKTRIIGFALRIVLLVLLVCFMDKELYGYDKEFHESIVDVTFEMMSPKYRYLPREYLKEGSTQPDKDREKIGAKLDPSDNKKHKRDTTRINDNLVNAIDRYKQHEGRSNPEEGLNQGARILAKAFHYVSDQTEPDTGRDFSKLMGGGFRGIVQNKLPAVMANDKAKQPFFGEVNRLCQKYQWGKEFVSKEITGIRRGLEKAIREILARPNLNKDKAKQEEAKNDIDRLIWEYLAQIVAIQNLMLEQFVKETKIEFGAFQPPHLQPQPSPPQIPPSAVNDVKVQEERCSQIDSALAAASKAKNINRFRVLVERAKAENCDCYQSAYSHLRNWEQQLQRSSIKPQPQPQPQPQAKPQPPTDNRKWIVWHGCAGPSFACVIELSRTTEIELRQSGRKVTIMGTYNTEQEARQATCAKFTGIKAGGQFAAGTLGNIGKDVYCVKNFFYYDSRENRYKCR